MTSFLVVSFKRSCNSPYSTTGWEIDLDCLDIEWFALEMNRDHSVILRLYPNTAFQTLLLTVMATPFLLRDSYPQ